MDHCHVFHTDAVHRSYAISDAKGVCACLWHTDTMCYLDERQRLLSAADQRGFLLLLFLHDGSKGHQGGEGRAAHCTQHPRPEGIDGWHTHTRWYQVLQQESESVDKGWVNHYWQAPVCEWPPVHLALTSLCHYCTTVLKLKCFAEDFNMIAAHATMKTQATTLSDLCCIWHSTLPRCAVSNIMVFIWVWVRGTGMDGKRQRT